MNYLDYGSNDEDSCSVEDVEFEAEHYDDADRDLPSVSDLEFIAANAAVDTFEFIDTGANDINSSASNVGDEPLDESSDDSGDESEEDMAVVTEGQTPAEDSSSSDSSSDSEDEIISKKQYQKKSKQISWLTEEEGDDTITGPLKTKNEIEEVIEVVEAKQLNLDGNVELLCIGEVMYRIDHECVVVIQADYTTSALNEGSVLCNVDGKVLGKIQEIFGPITTPFYTVRWKSTNLAANSNTKGGGGNAKGKKKGRQNNNKKTAVSDPAAESQPAAKLTVPSIDETSLEIEKDVSIEQGEGQSAMIDAAEVEAAAAPVAEPAAAAEAATAMVTEPEAAAKHVGLDITDVRTLFPVGAKLYTVQAHCNFVVAAQMQRAHAKGSDASNAYDEEPPEEELEFSDDEEEMAARLARKQAKRGTKAEAPDAAAIGDAIPPGTRPGASKRAFGKSGAAGSGSVGAGGRPGSAGQGQSYGHGAVGAGHAALVGYAPVPVPPQYAAPMMPAGGGGGYPYMYGQYAPPQQPFYGQQQQLHQQQYAPQQLQQQGYAGQPYQMHHQQQGYGGPTPGYPMQQQQYSPYQQQPGYQHPGYQQHHHHHQQQQPVYPQGPPQPGFLPAAAFVPGAYAPNQSAPGAQQQQQQVPQYQYQPLNFNNNPSGAKK